MRRWLGGALAVLVGLVAGGGAWLVGPAPRLCLNGEWVCPLQFSPDFLWLIVSEGTRERERLGHLVVDTTTGNARLHFPKGRVYAWAFSPDGRLLARAADYSDTEHGIDVWDLESGTEVDRLSWRVLPDSLKGNLPGGVLAFTPHGRLLLGSTTFGIWDVEERRRLPQLDALLPEHTYTIPSRPYTSDLFAVPGPQRLRLLSLKTGAVAAEFALPGHLRNYTWSAGGRFLAADFYGKPLGIHVADARTGIWHPIGYCREGMMQSVAEGVPLLAVWDASPEREGISRWFPLASPRGRLVRIVDIPTGRVLDKLPGEAALLAPGGTMLAIQTDGGSLELWDLPRPAPWCRCLVVGFAAAGVALAGMLVAGKRVRRRSSASAGGSALGCGDSAPSHSRGTS